jgi:hypothetical protein
MSLCPDPSNELGKGILPPDLEADLLMQGFVFARRLGMAGAYQVLCVAKQPIHEMLPGWRSRIHNNSRPTIVRSHQP